MSTLLELHKDCLNQVLIKDYYTDYLDGAIHLCGYISLNQVEKLEDLNSIPVFWKTFLQLLPDNDDIAKPPFDLVSDLATFKTDELVS